MGMNITNMDVPGHNGTRRSYDQVLFLIEKHKGWLRCSGFSFKTKRELKRRLNKLEIELLTA